MPPKSTRAKPRLDFTLAATAVGQYVRAFSPAQAVEVGGGTHQLLIPHRSSPVTVRAGRHLAGLTITPCGDGAIRPTLVQRAGSRRWQLQHC
jgi:methionyl-tRNA formyltransferase